ncbi:accessory factor UbiK family protein [Hyphobacterium sp. HN65]|uniref:Accessory factor UbiK family protein n=1 Tax=Hyphobacterium lacteum TaxID=3116575 RepID=A0ABU7LR98_9PROT|nr:accessory factor UbiK family protein [Hyphobacterium sp. HN65]MEE2526436.1 accessory factor UbiK family protein [Hyphobacterium sp. HN65]
MQTRNPLLNDIADLMTDAFAAAQAAGEEAQAVFRARADKMAANMDFVSREEFEAVKAVAQAAREENEALKARIEALEKTARKPAAPAKKPAARKSTAKKPASRAKKN